jgi:hypothetical protein
MRVAKPQRTRHPWRWTAVLGTLTLALVLAVLLIPRGDFFPTEQAQASDVIWTVDRLDDPTQADNGLVGPGGELDADAFLDPTAAAAACTFAANDCSLRGALWNANVNAGTRFAPTAQTDTINFDTTLTYPATLVLAAPLALWDGTVAGGSSIVDPPGGTTINGPSNFGLVITGAGAGNYCFEVQAPGGHSIKGLVINGCGDDGIRIETSNNTIDNNRIGTNRQGTAAVANTGDGIEIRPAAAATSTNNNTIGGTTGNLISGNDAAGMAGVRINLGAGATATGNVLLGNLIGTDVTGVFSVGNDNGVIITGGASGNTIGGTTAGVANVISGNNANGIVMTGATTSGNIVRGNCIGVQKDCASPRPNGAAGVRLEAGTHDNWIGGPSAGNVIAHNIDRGVVVTGGADDNRISQNSMQFNADCGIDLNAAVDNDNMAIGPRISTVTYNGGSSFTVSGAVGSAVAGSTVEVFVASNDVPPPVCASSGPPGLPAGEVAATVTAEGSCFVGFTTADATGAWSVNVTNIGGSSVVATETSSSGSTSEFGQAVGAPAGPGPGPCPLPGAAAPTATVGPATATNTPITGIPTNTPQPTASPTITGTPPTSTPTLTPTLPAMVTESLVTGCNFVTSTYPDDTQPATLAAAVSPLANLAGLWAQQPPPTWRGYNPLFPGASNMLPVDRLDVIVICMFGPGTWQRPPL